MKHWGSLMQRATSASTTRTYATAANCVNAMKKLSDAHPLLLGDVSYYVATATDGRYFPVVVLCRH